MQTKKKIITIVSILFVVSLIGVGIWIVLSVVKEQPQPNDGITEPGSSSDNSQDTPTNNDGAANQGSEPYVAQRTQEDLNTFVLENNPGLVDSTTNLPIYTIVRKQNPLENWYILRIRNSQQDTSDADVIIQDINGTLTIVAGPGTGLFLNKNLPEAVKKALSE
ncbi:hypothetical protein A2707_04345 [Candidatus Saccharibacteria bacterium RIFCSPHIGHO2_01_FULL_45_15]|nr:MAG: hypothetical protein A2707_04345 [Candidatus Saccharibacteria bacterium RIFCSPHIGHO2_01_FULL_45_15]OGL27170.1 MAG: hypothetical protein A3C39_01240 [Candidatus Saccharibacteria bacterium RIFCSPHIGHO2_02_FULL_46_12]OGL32790.1 MAG: hypothetical protein A3E76_05615 [Candidatus Saccharibacteria bacterium RIFCSPHIGHO2_12_FULL_44_22]